MVPLSQTVGETRFSALRGRCPSNVVVPHLREKEDSKWHVVNVVYILHAHRTGLLCLQQPCRLQRQQGILPFHQSAGTRSPLSWKRTRGLLQVVTGLARRFRCVSETNHPPPLGRQSGQKLIASCFTCRIRSDGQSVSV